MARQYEDEHTQAGDPRGVPEHRLLRDQRRQDRGRGAGRVAGLFNKDVSELNLDEAALLAGLPQAPTDYNPFLNPDGADEPPQPGPQRDGRAGLHQPGEGRAGEGRRPRARARLPLRVPHPAVLLRLRPAGADRQVRRRRRSARAGSRSTRRSTRGCRRWPSRRSPPTPSTARPQALVSRPTSTPARSSRWRPRSPTRTASSTSPRRGARQPGSSFKPYALTTAVDQGIDPDATYYSAPSSITLYPNGSYGEAWSVSGGGGGSMSLRDATANSVNTVFAQLVLDIGVEEMDDMAKRMGVTSPLSGYAPDVLGASDVTVLDQSNGFATLANGGVHHEPTAIAKVEFPDGEVDEPEDPEGTRVISDGVAYTVADVMKGTLEYGTAAGHGIGCPAAGKTGTTEEQADAWFVGYTPHVSTAVWVGNPDERVPLPGYGADLAAPIWHDYMMVAATAAVRRLPRSRRTRPTSPATTASTRSTPTTSRPTTDGDHPTTPTDEETDDETADEPHGRLRPGPLRPRAPARSRRRHPRRSRSRPTGRRRARRRSRHPADRRRRRRRPGLGGTLPWLSGEFELIAAIRERIASAGAGEPSAALVLGSGRRRRDHRSRRGDGDQRRRAGRGGALPDPAVRPRRRRPQGARRRPLRPRGDGGLRRRGLRAARRPGGPRARRSCSSSPTASREVAAAHGVAIAGGDVTRAPVLLVAVTVVGAAAGPDRWSAAAGLAPATWWRSPASSAERPRACCCSSAPSSASRSTPGLPPPCAAASWRLSRGSTPGLRWLAAARRR